MPSISRIDEAARLNPGVLRHQITWQRKNVIGRNSFGEDTYGDPAWLNHLTCKAQVKELNGRELERLQQTWAEVKYEIKQYRSAGLKSEMRLSWYIDGQVRTLDVLGILDPPGTGMYQLVYAKDHVE